mgnify:CR=1 FL=1
MVDVHKARNFRKELPLYASSGSAVFSPSEVEEDVENILNIGYQAYSQLLRMEFVHQGLSLLISDKS